MEFFLALMVALLIATPLLVDRFLRALPIAPACPTCRSVVSEVGLHFTLEAVIPAMSRTFVGECARCGWRGRMRWRLAPNAQRKG
jgi:hypothetical protein